MCQHLFEKKKIIYKPLVLFSAKEEFFFFLFPCNKRAKSSCGTAVMWYSWKEKCGDFTKWINRHFSSAGVLPLNQGLLNPRTQEPRNPGTQEPGSKFRTRAVFFTFSKSLWGRDQVLLRRELSRCSPEEFCLVLTFALCFDYGYWHTRQNLFIFMRNAKIQSCLQLVWNLTVHRRILKGA